MKKSIVALAVLSSLAGTAFAQSSVTLFGVMDVNARYNKAGGNTVSSLASDGQVSSRLGVRGVEDLGGGMKAGFWLESALAVDNGVAGDQTTSPTKLWNRRSTVSLTGDFGEIRLGRDKTSERNLIDEFDVFGGLGLGDVTKVYSALGAAIAGGSNNRTDNEVRYFLPSNLGGFYGSVDVAAGEGTNGQKSYGGRFGYKQGPLHVSGAAQVIYLVPNGPKYGIGSVAGSYDFGVVKAGLLLTEIKTNGRKETSWTINGSIPVGPSGVVKLSYTMANANGTAETAKVAYDANLMTAQYVYSLSKRTQLYTTVSKIDNKGAGKFALATSPAAYAGGGSGGFEVGVTHSF